jgi:phosphatidylserine decarboxylase
MPIAKEGLKEIALSTLALGALAACGAWLFWPVVIPLVLLWMWVLWFFRDPTRRHRFEPGELCAPADGTVTEVTQLDTYEGIGGPAVRIGIFLSLFNVHINRAPCSGRVRSRSYQRGVFLDARDPESGRRNESNMLIIDPDGPMPGPVVVRQVAGMLARRIICHVQAGQHLPIGDRFGMIKFGSRTELIIPRRAGTEIKVQVGDNVKAGLTIVACQARETSKRLIVETRDCQELEAQASRASSG